jgi:hypothetical protein
MTSKAVISRKRVFSVRRPIPGLGLFPGETVVYFPLDEHPPQFVAVRDVSLDLDAFDSLVASGLVEELPREGPTLRLVRPRKPDGAA